MLSPVIIITNLVAPFDLKLNIVLLLKKKIVAIITISRNAEKYV
jgi:hypothetical protein